MARHGLSPDCCLVAHDDLDLSIGRVKIKVGGSSGGHKGLISITHHLGTENYGRLRIGIGRPADKAEVPDYVLSPFSSNQQESLAQLFDRLGANEVAAMLPLICEDQALRSSLLNALAAKSFGGGGKGGSSSSSGSGRAAAVAKDVADGGDGEAEEPLAKKQQSWGRHSLAAALPNEERGGAGGASPSSAAPAVASAARANAETAGPRPAGNADVGRDEAGTV